MKGLKKELRHHWQRYLMCLPAVAAVVTFGYLPLIGLVMAFQQLDFRKGIFGGKFVGLRNFKFLFATSDAWVITRNTIGYNVVFIILGLFLSVTLAIVMNELVWKRYSKVLQTIFIMPYFLSMVVVSTILYAFLAPTNGFINSRLMEAGGQMVNWYNWVDVWPYLLVLVHVYCKVGFDSIIYMAVISGISQEYYEAAVLDGASKLQQIFYITIPHLKPIICINLIRAIGNMFRADFGLFFSVPRDSGTLYPATDVLDTYIYRSLKTMNNPGMSTAAGLYQSVVGFILVLIANKIISKIDEDSALF